MASPARTTGKKRIVEAASAELPKRVPPSRIIMWTAMAVIIVFGVVMFFRYGTRIAPALI